MTHRSLRLFAVGVVIAVLPLGCRSPSPPPRDQPVIQPPAPDLPDNQEPAIEPDTGTPIGPGGIDPVPLVDPVD